MKSSLRIKNAGNSRFYIHWIFSVQSSCFDYQKEGILNEAEQRQYGNSTNNFISDLNELFFVAMRI